MKNKITKSDKEAIVEELLETNENEILNKLKKEKWKEFVTKYNKEFKKLIKNYFEIIVDNLDTEQLQQMLTKLSWSIESYVFTTIFNFDEDKISEIILSNFQKQYNHIRL